MGLTHDVLCAIRLLRKQPGFAAVTILTLGLGIGANAAVFSVVHALLLKPLPYAGAEQLVDVSDSLPGIGHARAPVSPREFLDYGAEARSFEALAAVHSVTKNLTGADQPERLRGAHVTPAFFSLLGIEPVAGRLFSPREAQEGGEGVVLLSESFWRRRFGGDPDVINRTLHLDGRPAIVVGIVPAKLRLPEPDTAFWQPLVFSPKLLSEAERGSRFLGVGGRLRPGTTLEQAQAEMDVIAARLRRAHPEDYQPQVGWRIVVTPLQEALVGDSRPALMLLLGAVGLVLLIACANVANLLLARAANRRREIVVRAALGGTRTRILRQLLVESVVLAVAGGCFGVLLAYAGLDVVRAAASVWIETAEDIAIDRTVITCMLGVSVLTGTLFGLAPALWAAGVDCASGLREGRAVVAPRQWLRSALVVAEVAMALMLFIGAGLLVRSFWNVSSQDLGIRAERVLTLQLSLAPGTPASQAAYIDRMRERLAPLPSVSEAAAVMNVPLSGNWDWSVSFEGQAVATGSAMPNADFNMVTPSYFRAMGIPLVAGRDFMDTDRREGEPVVVVSRTFARRYLAARDPLGARFKFGGPDSPHPWMTIVGVVGDVRSRGVATDVRPAFYVPHTQTRFPAYGMAAVLRTTGDPAALAPLAVRAIRAVDKEQVAHVRTMTEIVRHSIADRRLSMLLLASFASLALLLAMLGIYSVIAYVVALRTNEIGVRVALGASRSDVVRLVVSYGGRLVAFGAGVGLVGAFLASSVLAKLLFGVEPTDGMTFACVTLLLVLAGLLACVVPASRAARLDPMVALRTE